MLRRFALPLFAVLLLGLLAACGDDGATAAKKTPAGETPVAETPPAGETPAEETPTSGGEETPEMSFADACQLSHGSGLWGSCRIISKDTIVPWESVIR